MNVLPLFKSQYSLMRSILTLNKAEDKLDLNYPISIFQIAKEHNLSKVTIVDDSISGFLEAHENAKKIGIQFNFGLRLSCIDNINNKNEDSLKTLSKIVIFVANTDGYYDLIKISSLAAKDGFYYHPNIDLEHLKQLWTKNLILAIPFYDSFLFSNALEGHLCVPNFSFTKPVFFVENSGLPFDKIIQDKVHAFAASIGAPILPARSIYYYQKKNFLAYLTFRCINDRTSIEKPELEHFSSDAFCFEEWQEQEKNFQSFNF